MSITSSLNTVILQSRGLLDVNLYVLKLCVPTTTLYLPLTDSNVFEFWAVLFVTLNWNVLINGKEKKIKTWKVNTIHHGYSNVLIATKHSRVRLMSLGVLVLTLVYPILFVLWRARQPLRLVMVLHTMFSAHFSWMILYYMHMRADE